MSQELPVSTIQPDEAINFNILSFMHINTVSQTIRCNSLYDVSIFGNKYSIPVVCMTHAQFLPIKQIQHFENK